MRIPAHALLLLLALILPFIGLQAQASETVTYYHNDALGSPIAATDQSGSLLWRETYRPYGERLNNPAASSNNPIWYTGKRQDTETGLVYMGSRYYDPRLGRFLSIDPIEPDENNLHSLNRYAYANNNPYKFTDPDGKLPVLVIPIVVWMGGGAAATGAVNAVTQYATSGDVRWGGLGGVADAAGDGAILGPVFGLASARSVGVASVTARSSAQVTAKEVPNNVFHNSAQSLTEVGQQNIRSLRGWAESKGWVKNGGDGPEVWGVQSVDGTFSWRLKIKPQASSRDGLGTGSQQARFDARLDDRGNYVNPFTGQTGGRSVGTHLPLERKW